MVDLRDCGVTAVRDGARAAHLAGRSRWTRCRSQALVAGYRCAIVAAGLLAAFFPLNMTAAGTVPPAEVLVLGAGVAGLQAIATAQAARRRGQGLRRARRRRRGDPLDGRAGHRARPRDARGRRRLRPGDDRGPRRPSARAARRPTSPTPTRSSPPLPSRAGTAPLLVTAAMVEQMKPGSVVVDLAAETGGNVEGSAARRGGAHRRRPGVGRPQRARPDAGPASPPLRPEHREPAAADDRSDGGRRARLRRRDRRRLLRHPRRAGAARAHPRRPGRRRRRERADRLADGLRARRVRRLRGDLEGLLDAAHAADVGRQRDPRDHPARRDPGRRPRRVDASRSSSALVAVVLAAVNMVGGFVVTDRMLQMFTGPQADRAAEGRRAQGTTR